MADTPQVTRSDAHLPGPWKPSRTYGVWTIRGGEDRPGFPYVARVASPVMDGATVYSEEATARLIAAAPDLLGAAEAAHRALTLAPGTLDARQKVALDALAEALEKAGAPSWEDDERRRYADYDEEMEEAFAGDDEEEEEEEHTPTALAEEAEDWDDRISNPGGDGHALAATVAAVKATVLEHPDDPFNYRGRTRAEEAPALDTPDVVALRDRLRASVVASCAGLTIETRYDYGALDVLFVSPWEHRCSEARLRLISGLPSERRPFLTVMSDPEGGDLPTYALCRVPVRPVADSAREV